MTFFEEQIEKNEKSYKFHKGDKVSFHIKGKKYYGIITGYLFYGADKFCSSPAYIIEYETRFLHKKKQIVAYAWEEDNLKKEV